MTTEELREAATKAYFEFGKAVKKAFNLEGNLLTAPLFDTLNSDDEEKIKEFITYCREEMPRLIEMINRLSS